MMKKLVLFDLDNTLTESRSKFDPEMRELLVQLLEVKKVAIVCGVGTDQLLVQLDGLTSPNLFLFPANSSKFLHFNNMQWEVLHEEMLTPEEKARIIAVIFQAYAGFDIPWDKSYGEIISDKGGQVTFAALGEEAPLELKKKWDPKHSKRLAIKKKLDKKIPEFEVTIGGYTSIDISKVSKAGCIPQIKHHLGYDIEDIVFIADAMFKGGNDYPVKQTGVDSIEVSCPEDTKKWLRNMFCVLYDKTHH